MMTVLRLAVEVGLEAELPHWHRNLLRFSEHAALQVVLTRYCCAHT